MRRRIGLLLATALVPAILVGLLLVVLDPLDAEPEADPRAEPEAPGAPGLLNRAAGLAVRPGPLAAAHAELEGLSHCLDCHGASNHVPDARCLSCHEDIGVRAARMLPLHGTFAGSCASCHPDHLGVNASLIDLDPKEFAHDRTRFPLRGAHVGLECETCHVVGENGSEEPSFHYLAVPFAACEDCHLDVHAGGERTEGNVVPIRRVALDAPLRERPPAPPEQPLASRNCADCHSETGFGWIALEPGGFAHHQDTHFDLAGKHASVQCDACHSEKLGHPFLARGPDALGRVIPESHRLGAGGHRPVDQREQTDAIERRLDVARCVGDLHQRWVDVARTGGHVGDAGRGDARGPFDDRGNAKTPS